MSRRAAVGVPVGVAAAVVLAVVATVLVRAGGSERPARLPLSLAGAGGAAAAETAADSRLAAPGMPGGVDYRYVGDVPADLPDEADVYRLSDGGVDRDAVRRLADALGLAGAPITEEKDALTVRSGEWVLRVSTTASRMWGYYREMPAPPGCTAPGAEPAVTEEQKKAHDARCAGGEVPPSEGDGTAGICLEGADSPCNDTPETADGGGTGGSTGSAGSGTASAGAATAADQPAISCAPAPSCPPDTKCAPAPGCGYEEPKPLPLPSEDAARAVAQRVFDATGVGTARIRADRGYDAWYLSANIRVSGVEVIGLGQSVSVDGDGKVRDASGSLAAASVLDRYPLVDVEAGLARLEKQSGGLVRPLIACDPSAPECAAAPAEPQVVDVTGVRLGLLFSPVWEDDREKAFLAPAWVYDVKGRDYPEAVIAITDEFLAEVSPEAPVDGGPQVDPAQPEPGVLVDPVPPASARPEPAQPEPAAS